MDQSIREVEYQAMRRFLKDLDNAEKGPAAKVSDAVREELTDRQRQMVRMYYVEQMGMRDIARELGVAPSTVSRTIRRGRLRLTRCLRYGSMTLLERSLQS